MTKSWQLDRRTYLKGVGAALALPLLESMMPGTARAASPTAAAAQDLPKRMCCILFPYGVAIPKDDDPAREWGWFPTGSGRDYRLTKPLEPLAPLMDDVTVLAGLSHPQCRTMNGHDTGDTFLTGSKFHGANCQNSISIDQLAADHIGDRTRFSSLALSSDGGVGPRTRATTLSYTAKGQPIPALANPRQVFQRLFADDGASQAKRRELENSASLIDLVLEHSRSLDRKLGKQDHAKLDEYLSSVRDVEHRVERARSWLNAPRPKVDPTSVSLDADPKGPEEYIRAMYDLMFLALQTDSTRLTTYMIGSYGPTVARTFPTAVGLSDWHGLAHGARKEGGAEKLGAFDRFLTQNLAYFLQRLRDTPEGDGNMLDRTLVFYGSSNSNTHQNTNFPLVLAGGKRLGLKHNQFLQYDDSTPLADLFVTMLRALDVPAERFADSTGLLTEVLA